MFKCSPMARETGVQSQVKSYCCMIIIITTQRRRKTSEEFFNKIFTSHFIARVRKGCSWFACERELETEHNCNILTPLLWPSRCVFLVLLMLNRRPRGSLCFVMAFFIASYQHLLRTSAHQGPRPLRPGVAFSTTSSPLELELWTELNSLNFRLDCVIS